MLLGRTEPAVQRKHLGARAAHTLAGEVPGEGIRRVTNLVLTAEEHQHIAVAFAAELVDRGDDAVDHVDGLAGSARAVA